jgi:hypothetical protein
MNMGELQRFGTEVAETRRGYEATASPAAAPTSIANVMDAAPAHKMWGIAGAGDVFHPVGETTASLPPGFYRFVYMNNQLVCLRVRNDTDSLVMLPDSESDRLLDEMRQFLGLKAAFKSRGLLYKRGVMLYGPPGSGKTATIQQLAKMVAAEMNSIAILGDTEPGFVASGLQVVRDAMKAFGSAFMGTCVAASFIFATWQAGELLSDYLRIKLCLATQPTIEMVRACVQRTGS